jgi:multidrug efflux pump subunit AcrB
MDSATAVEVVPVKRNGTQPLLLRDVADVKESTMPGELDRYNMRRLVSMTANIQGEDLGRVGDRLAQAIQAAGTPPAGVQVDVRGQVTPMREMFGGLGGGIALPAQTPLTNWSSWVRFVREFCTGLTGGLLLAVAVIFLLLTAYFQSVRLALTAVAAVPAVLSGVILSLLLTGTTVNLQSFMGAIMAVGVAVANSILLVTFAERYRREGQTAIASAVEGARSRVRAILMTNLAMTAGMVPMALGFGEGGDQMAPLGRAVIGGLLASTATTLLVLPAVFTLCMAWSPARSASLDPLDPDSHLFVPNADQA